VPVLHFIIGSLVVWSVGVTARPEALSGGPQFAVEEITIAQAHSAFRSGALTCRALVDTYLARIAKYDTHGPSLNAIASINANAVSEADRLDRRFAEAGLSGPLHCVPVIVKDNIETEGWETAAGSLALKGFVPAHDATAIVRLKAAGAIILAKANMADLALNALTTVNRLHGPTKNPYALDRVPAGSSGGTAVAIAANFGLVGLGTDTGKSVRAPASHTSLVGVRPTMGLTSRTGMIPLDLLSDVIGPMARTVEDAAALLEVLVGWDPDDPTTEAVRLLPSVPRVQQHLADGFGGVRIGVLRQAYQGSPLKIDGQINKLFTRALADLKSLGAEIVDPVSIEPVAAMPKAEQCRGLKYDLNEYLARQGSRAPVRSLAEIIFSGRFDPTIENDLRGMEANPQNGPDSQSCAASRAYRAAMAAKITAAMERHKLNAMVYPTWSQPPQLVYQVSNDEAGQTLRFATAAGFPAITVPMGFTTEVLPVGLSFLGGAWTDAQLLRMAHGYDRATRHRRPPVLAPPIPMIDETSPIIR
jgi:Asp-tRNA(Asn)/Glu-tRNA(Gln) amidotransferase A subunit family amidase